MERDSILYKIRRRGQVAAHKMMSDEFMSQLYFQIILKKKLNLKNPQTFNEKIQWMKLYYYPKNKLIVQCADKYAVRDYIREKGYAGRLVPLIGEWNKADQIKWELLPDQFVLKCNHGCAYNIVVQDKEKQDKNKTLKQLDEWMREDFGAFNIELHYSEIKPHRIICEQFLGSSMTDYKFFCFHGEPKFIYVSHDLVHDRQAEIGFFYLDGSKMPLRRDDYRDIPEVELPEFFSEMIDMAKKLSSAFPFVRVDFFLTNETYYFAELTFTPGAGMMPFNPEKYDLEWGKLLDISDLIKEYEEQN